MTTPPPDPTHDAPTPADDVALAVAPVTSALRADVGRATSFLRQIRPGFLKSGLYLLTLTTIAGTAIPFLSGFSDWYMHLGMYLVLFAFVLLYVRAHLRRFRILEALWALVSATLLGYFAFILIDLVPERLDVLSNRLRPDGLVGPEVALRPRAELLWLPVALLIAQLVWLALHVALIGRAGRRRRPEATHGTRESHGPA